MNLSIIIPVYNREEFVTACLQSVIKCPWEDLNIIIVDDGSIDNSGEICMSYCEKDTRIKYMYQPNAGIGAARNLGMKHSESEYTMFLDSDDTLVCQWWNIIQELITKEPNSDLYMFDYNIVENDSIKKVDLFANGFKDINDVYYWYCTAYGYVWSKVFKTDIIKTNNLQFRCDVNVSEDSLFMRDYMHYMHSAAHSSKVLVNYYINPNSASHVDVIHFKEYIISTAARASLVKEQNEGFGIKLYDYNLHKLDNYLFSLKEIAYRSGYAEFVDNSTFAMESDYFNELVDMCYSTLNLRRKWQAKMLMSGKLKILYKEFLIESNLKRLYQKIIKR